MPVSIVVLKWDDLLCHDLKSATISVRGYEVELLTLLKAIIILPQALVAFID
jgi:hypothetical protein